MNVNELNYTGEVQMTVGAVTCGFQYAGVIRELIMRSKIKNDLFALSALTEIANEKFAPLVKEYDHPSVLILPAPASFWGRLKGRFDIAQVLGLSMFTKAQVYTGLLPGGLVRVKRAGRNVSHYGVISKHIKSAIKDLKFHRIFMDERAFVTQIKCANRILVVDDVMTTGFTMSSLFEQLKILGATRVEGLAMAVSTDSVAEINE